MPQSEVGDLDHHLPIALRFERLANDCTDSVYTRIGPLGRLSRADYALLISLDAYGESTEEAVRARSGRRGECGARSVESMLDRAYILRSPNPGSMRDPLLMLSARGRSLADAARPLLAAQEAAMLAALSREERLVLSGLLDKLAHAGDGLDRA